MSIINSPRDDRFDPDSPGIYAKTKRNRLHLQERDSEGLPLLSPEKMKDLESSIKVLEITCLFLLDQFNAKKWPHELEEDAPEIIRDAQEILYHKRSMERRAEQNRISEALMHAYLLGRLCERLEVRWADPMVAKERKRRIGHRKQSGEFTSKQEAIRIYSELRKRHPRAKKTSLVKRVANKVGCSERSTWTYLEGIPP